VIEGVEFVAEIIFERRAVADIRTVLILQADKLRDEFVFELAFG
jgi:hypothetical protein